MPSVEELSVRAIRSAMAPGYEIEDVARELALRAGDNITALRMARARIERGAGWRAGPIGQRARDALSRAIELKQPDIDLTDHDELDLSEQVDDTLLA